MNTFSRLFFNFLDSLLDEQNFKMNLLILEVYGMIIDRLKSKIKPNLRSVVCALLKHACDHKVVVRIENYRVLEKLMLAVKPNQVITQLLDFISHACIFPKYILSYHILGDHPAVGPPRRQEGFGARVDPQHDHVRPAHLPQQ